jgi:predicted signal transduction protein with EAL and GGDEF domain
MGLQVIAEGIEDGDQARWLLEHGCAMAQGYAFGRPAPLPARELGVERAPQDVAALAALGDPDELADLDERAEGAGAAAETDPQEPEGPR